MTFKECRKYGREQLNEHHKRYGYMYKDKNGDYTFSLIYYNTKPPEYILEKNGMVDKVVNGSWEWDFEKRGMYPENKKGGIREA